MYSNVKFNEFDKIWKILKYMRYEVKHLLICIFLFRKMSKMVPHQQTASHLGKSFPSGNHSVSPCFLAVLSHADIHVSVKSKISSLHVVSYWYRQLFLGQRGKFMFRQISLCMFVCKTIQQSQQDADTICIFHQQLFSTD